MIAYLIIKLKEVRTVTCLYRKILISPACFALYRLQSTFTSIIHLLSPQPHHPQQKSDSLSQAVILSHGVGDT